MNVFVEPSQERQVGQGTHRLDEAEAKAEAEAEAWYLKNLTFTLKY